MDGAKPAATARRVRQVCVVVRDVQRAMEHYWSSLGMGPWRIYNFEPPALTEPTLRGKQQPYSMRLAVMEVGDPDHSVMWELVQPLEGPSIYKEFLAEHGEGLHHVWIMTDDFDETAAEFEKQGMGILMSGNYLGSTYAYLDTRKHLSMLAEIVKWPAGWSLPEPDGVWPSDA